MGKTDESETNTPFSPFLKPKRGSISVILARDETGNTDLAVGEMSPRHTEVAEGGAAPVRSPHRLVRSARKVGRRPVSRDIRSKTTKHSSCLTLPSMKSEEVVSASSETEDRKSKRIGRIGRSKKVARKVIPRRLV